MTDQTFQPSAGGRPRERPADRYGDRPPTSRARRLMLVGFGLLAGLVVVAWLWVAVMRSSPPIRVELLGFDVISSTSIEIRFAVEREPADAVACVVRARGADGSEVGRAQVLVAADDRERVDVSHTLRTLHPAVTGEVVTCQVATPEIGVGAGRPEPSLG